MKYYKIIQKSLINEIIALKKENKQFEIANKELEQQLNLHIVGNPLKELNDVTFEDWMKTNYMKWDDTLYASKQGLLKDRQTLYRMYLAEYNL